MRLYSYTLRNGKRSANIKTAHGNISLPAFMPVTTFGDKYPLDKLVRPYLKRMCPCLMVSYYYAQAIKERPAMPLFIDSGGFASLFQGAEIVEQGDFARIRTREGEEIDPLAVLSCQEQYADLGATLDFIISAATTQQEARRRQELTIKNALYARQHQTNPALMLYATLQCWDEASARSCAQIYAEAGFEGIALGGMAPRARDAEYLKSIVRAVRETAPHCALHVLGCGNAAIIPQLIAAGADSFDSSSYARSVASARGSAASRGVHTDLYAALQRLSALNAAVSAKAETLTELTPNARLCCDQGLPATTGTGC